MGFYTLNEPRRLDGSISPLRIEIIQGPHAATVAATARAFIAGDDVWPIACSPAMPGSDGDSGGNTWVVWSITIIYQRLAIAHGNKGGVA